MATVLNNCHSESEARRIFTESVKILRFAQDDKY